MLEIWRDTKDFPAYQVSTLGRTRRFSAREWKVHNVKVSPAGYPVRSLSREGKVCKVFSHRLVAQAFVSNPDNKPFVNHIDGVKTNNRADNLEWVTHSENVLHAHRIGLIDQAKGSRSPHAKFGDSGARLVVDLLRASKMSYNRIAAIMDVSSTTIKNINNGLRWRDITSELVPSYPIRGQS